MSSMLVLEKPASANKLNAAWRIRSRIGPAGYGAVGSGVGLVFLILDTFTRLRYESVPLLHHRYVNVPLIEMPSMINPKIVVTGANERTGGGRSHPATGQRLPRTHRRSGA